MLQDRLELSERRACRVTGQHRSTQRRLPARGRGDDALRTELHAFSRGHPRWGYRRVWATLREEGWTVNRKRVQRLWREEGLRVPLKRRKRQRLGDSAQPARRLSAERPNHVWALDFQFDQTADGRVLKLLNIVDEHTREALAVVAARRINADATAATLDRIVAGRGTAPGYIRCDNGPELTANALRDWCRFSGTGSSYIEPGAPWENPFVESFNGRLRDEFLAVEQFDSLLEAQVLLEDWRIEYNTQAPAQQPGLARPGYLRRALGGSATRWTLISGGLAKGVRSRDVLPQHQSQVTLIDDHQMVETFAPERSDHTLRDGVRLRCPHRSEDRLDPDRSRLADEGTAVRAVAIPDQIAGLLPPRRRLQQLTPHPRRCRMCRHVEMHDAAARVRDEEDVQRLEGERLHGEEVRSPELRAGWRGRFARTGTAEGAAPSADSTSPSPRSPRSRARVARPRCGRRPGAGSRLRSSR